MSNRIDRWVDILIREFNTADDVEYAGQIYDLVKNRPVGWKGGAGLVLLTALMTLAGVSWALALSRGDVVPGIVTAGGALSWLATRLPARVWGRPKRDVSMDSLIYGIRPDMKEVERALRQIPHRLPGDEVVWEEVFSLLEEQKEIAPGTLIEELSSKDWKMRFAARHALLARGGEAAKPLIELTRSKRKILTAREGSDVKVPVPVNREPSVKRASAWILDNIARDTVRRLGWSASRLICPYCLTHFSVVSLSWTGQGAMNYIGCRSCGQSREYIERTLIAVLDREMAERHVKDGHALQVNWFVTGTLFDFDAAEIVRASDEDVERFAVQVGNDLDEYRQPRYAHMTCRVLAQCRLSENTLKILESLFGKVERNAIRSEKEGEGGIAVKE